MNQTVNKKVQQKVKPRGGLLGMPCRVILGSLTLALSLSSGFADDSKKDSKDNKADVSKPAPADNKPAVNPGDSKAAAETKVKRSRKSTKKKTIPVATTVDQVHKELQALERGYSIRFLRGQREYRAKIVKTGYVSFKNFLSAEQIKLRKFDAMEEVLKKVEAVRQASSKSQMQLLEELEKSAQKLRDKGEIYHEPVDDYVSQFKKQILIMSAFWIFEADLVKQQNTCLGILKSTQKDWIVKDKSVYFKKQADSNRFNECLAVLKKIVANQNSLFKKKR